MKHLIVYCISIYPNGRNFKPMHRTSGGYWENGADQAGLERFANRSRELAHKLGITEESGEPKSSGGEINGAFFRLAHGNCLLLTIEGDKGVVRAMNQEACPIVLEGTIENDRYMTVSGVDYSLHGRQPNPLEKMGLNVLEIHLKG